MSYFSFLFVLLCLFAVPAWAADQTSVPADERAFILQLFEVRPPGALVDASIRAVAQARFRDGDPAQDDFISRLQLAVDYDRIEAVMMRAMADLYSRDELQAMVDYYTSDVGQAAEAKVPQLREKIAPVIKEMLDKGILNVVTSPSPGQSTGK